MRDIAQIKVFQYTFFPRMTLLDIVEKPQNEHMSLFQRNCFIFNYQVLWNTLDQKSSRKLLNQLTEQELLQFLFEDENVLTKYLKLLQIKTKLIPNWIF